MRLQRILLLRDLGLGLPAIAEILDHEPDAEQALGRHLDWLRQEQDRLARQIVSVRQTMEALKDGGQIMAEHMFDGFDHTHYKDEVEERWGKDAYAKSDAWWRGMAPPRRRRGSSVAGSSAATGLRRPNRVSQRTVRRRRSWPGDRSNG